MNTGFVDKNEKEIFTGDTIVYRKTIRTGTTYPDKRNNTFAIMADTTISGVVRFGIWKISVSETIQTFYVETEQTTSYMSYFWCSRRGDAPKKITQNLSEVLTLEIARTCEVI